MLLVLSMVSPFPVVMASRLLDCQPAICRDRRCIGILADHGPTYSLVAVGDVDRGIRLGRGSYSRDIREERCLHHALFREAKESHFRECMRENTQNYE